LTQEIVHGTGLLAKRLPFLIVVAVPSSGTSAGDILADSPILAHTISPAIALPAVSAKVVPAL
jgi:hypothetical protein